MSELLSSKKDQDVMYCIIHVRSKVSSKISPFTEKTWNVVLNASEIHGHELCSQSK